MFWRSKDEMDWARWSDPNTGYRDALCNKIVNLFDGIGQYQKARIDCFDHYHSPPDNCKRLSPESCAIIEFVSVYSQAIEYKFPVRDSQLGMQKPCDSIKGLWIFHLVQG